MGKDWNKVPLSDVAEVNSRSINSEFHYDPIGYVDISSVTEGSINEIKLIPIKTAPSRAKRLLKHGSIILSTVRPNLRAFAFVKTPKLNTVVSTGFAVIDAFDTKIDARFLYYNISNQSYTEYLINHAKGSAYPAVDSTIIRNSLVYCPPLPTQKRISAILGAFDDLIENNNRRIQILEEMAQSIYIEWFVKFKFPGHENAKFRNSGTEYGIVPEGWEVVTLDSVIEINPKIELSKESKRYFLGMEYVGFQAIVNLPHKKTLKNGRKFKHRNVILPRITPSLENGKGAFVLFEDPKEIACGSTEFIIFGEKVLNAEYIYCLSREENFRKHAENSMVGASGRQRVQENCFKEYSIILPTKLLLDKFSNTVFSMYTQMYRFHYQSQKLKKLRDVLLPKLVSGNLDIDA